MTRVFIGFVKDTPCTSSPKEEAMAAQLKSLMIGPIPGGLLSKSGDRGHQERDPNPSGTITFG